jgi:TPR repeat protein
LPVGAGLLLVIRFSSRLRITKELVNKSARKKNAAAARLIQIVQRFQLFTSSNAASSPSRYQKGRAAYQTKRFSDAVPFLTEAAGNGDERAMTLMAGILQGGLDGRPADSNRSYSYLKAAAEKGFGPAIGSLGSITLTGKGVPKDLAEARRLLLLADKRNYPRATALSVFRSHHVVPFVLMRSWLFRSHRRQ